MHVHVHQYQVWTISINCWDKYFQIAYRQAINGIVFVAEMIGEHHYKCGSGQLQPTRRPIDTCIPLIRHAIRGPHPSTLSYLQ